MNNKKMGWGVLWAIVPAVLFALFSYYTITWVRDNPTSPEEREVRQTEEKRAYDLEHERWKSTQLQKVDLDKTADVEVIAASTVADKELAESDQDKRKALIDKLIAEGIFIKIEKPTELPRAYVGKGFYGLTFDQKESFANLILSYYILQDPKANILILRDGYTNKQIGTFDKYGLHLE